MTLSYEKFLAQHEFWTDHPRAGCTCGVAFRFWRSREEEYQDHLFSTLSRRTPSREEIVEAIEGPIGDLDLNVVIWSEMNEAIHKAADAILELLEER